MTINDKESLITKAFQNLEPEQFKQILDVEMLKQVLTYCSWNPGADIIIQIKHSDGLTASAKLYDHAALVTGLHNALELFQSECL